jgi:asparagine synthetase B (glutamine-hydrolysing)|tara:strand:+ start:13 stop:396 length:384 start_codon:yes stop_codon:yes gene_type:complete
MITFKELYSNLDEFKKVNLAQRKKMAIRMKKLTKSSSFKAKVAKSKLKVAPPEKLKIKAQKKAKEKIISKFYPLYKDMPLSARVKVDQQIAIKYGSTIAKMSQKLIPVMKAMEFEKVKKAKEAKANA